MPFSRNEVILLPIPFTNLSSRKVHPAIVVGHSDHAGDVFVVPISSVLRNIDFVLNEQIDGSGDEEPSFPDDSALRTASTSKLCFAPTSLGIHKTPPPQHYSLRLARVWTGIVGIGTASLKIWGFPRGRVGSRPRGSRCPTASRPPGTYPSPDRSS